MTLLCLLSVDMLPPRQTELFNGAFDDKVTIFAKRTRWQDRCIDIIPECIERAHEAYGISLPHVSFYFSSGFADFKSCYRQLFGGKPRWSDQRGAGSFINGQGIALIADRTKRGEKDAELGVVMHEYSHALLWAQIANKQFKVPSWLDEGFADFLAIPWYQERFKGTQQTIKNEFGALRLPSYRSFSRSIYPTPKAGYAIARLIVIELMRNQKFDMVAHILEEAKRRNGEFPDVINEICGFTPKQLYEKVLADCEVEQPTAVRARKKSRDRKFYWISWESRKEIPNNFRECVDDLYFWKLEHYGLNYDEHKLDSYKYPHWHTLAIAYLNFLKNTKHAAMKKSERDLIRSMPRLDRGAKLLTYVAMEDILPVFLQALPLETVEYLGECIESLSHENGREHLQKEMSVYLQKLPPKVDMTPLERFTNEFDAFTSYRFEILGGNSDSANYDRWPQLSTAFVRLLKNKPLSKWSQSLQRCMQSLILHDEHRYLPNHIPVSELDVLFEFDLPDSLRQYLRGATAIRQPSTYL